MAANAILITLFLSFNVIMADETGMGKRPVEFFAEQITLAVDDSAARIECEFHFRNNLSGQRNFPVIFPFYVDSQSLFPDYIDACIAGPDRRQLEVKILPERNAAVINIPLAESTTIWRLQYRQRITGSMARYILTSTQAWGRPLEKATYRFIVPKSFGEIVVWPQADSTADTGEFIEYWAHRNNFMPERDMEIRWAKKQF
jgi:hypothetical protein